MREFDEAGAPLRGRGAPSSSSRRRPAALRLLGRDPLADLEPLLRRVHAYVAYRVGAAEADDVTHDVFERAVRYRETYDPRRGKPITWLLGIARRCCDDARRARAESPDEPDPDHDDLVAADAVDLEDRTVQRLTLAEGLAKLSAPDRDVIALRFGADLSTRQIAELLGLTTTAVDVRVHRALARLREAMTQTGSTGSADPVSHDSGNAR